MHGLARWVAPGLWLLLGFTLAACEAGEGTPPVDGDDGDEQDAGPDGEDSGQDAGEDAGQDGADPAGEDDGGTGEDDSGQGADAASGCNTNHDCPVGWWCRSPRCEQHPFQDMLLHAEGGRLVRPDGQPVVFRGAISCCGGGYGWPLYDDAWVELLAGYGVTFLHARLGPFLTGPGGESDWAVPGGGYVEQGGLADLGQWNEPFWAEVRRLLELAGSHGMWVEVDLADGWAIKHCRWGDTPGYSAWDPAGNAQGEDACAAAGSAAVAPGSRHEAWIRKVVAETGRFGNVLYQDGNEIDQVPGYAPAWSLGLEALVRDEEARWNYPRHPFGTNSGDPSVMQAAAVDYLEFHQDTARDPAGCHGKPCGVNEYNPDPPLTPAGFQAQYCAAQAWGTYFWYWRHGQPEPDMLASLASMGQACGGGCAFPQGVPEQDFTGGGDSDPAIGAAVNAVMAGLSGCDVGSSCPLGGSYPTAQSWFDAVNGQLRAQGFCAGQHEVGVTDEIAVSSTGFAGRWYGYHVFNYGGSMVVWHPGADRGWWTIDPSWCP